MAAAEHRQTPERMETGPEFLSRGAVARLFGVSVSTVTRWARSGLLPAARTPGGHYRFRADDVRRIARAGLPNDLVRLD